MGPLGLLTVCARLNQIFGGVLSLHNNTEWLLRSPNLTTCDVFLWGYLKDRVFRTHPECVLNNMMQMLQMSKNSNIKYNVGKIKPKKVYQIAKLD